MSKKPLLDIIITRYNEPFDVCKKFFDMLKYQRVADMDRVNIILVQDGKEDALDWKECLSGYPYHIKTVTISHSGTATARNIGLRYAESDWVMFCDIDDMFCDVCSIAMILDLLPTSECDIIWGRYVIELVWRKGKPYLQTVNTHNFLNTTCKLYRRQFLTEHDIKFFEDIPYQYEYAFNAVCLTETPPSRIRHLTTEFYPYFKTYRQGSYKSTKEYYIAAGRELFFANIRIATNLQSRGYTDEASQFLAKALCFAYYSIHDPEKNDNPGITEQEVKEFIFKYRNEIASVSNNDIIALLDETETMMMNIIQRLYNEYRLEYYLKNDNLTFNEYLDALNKSYMLPDIIEEHDAENIQVVDMPFDTKLHALRGNKTHKDNPRVVIYCGTANVYEDMMTSCKSLLCNTPVDKVIFLTEDDTFPFELPDIVETINVKNQQYFPHDGPNFDNAWTYMCMIRAAFPEMFPQFSKILSLDIDIVIDDDVSDLWDYDISDYYLAGVPEKQRQKTEDDPIYINFGVVMMNLDKLRQDNKSAEIISALNERKIDCPEQTAYNEACAHHILELPTDFNTTVYSHITGKSEHERILHYAGQTFWKHYANVKQYSKLSWDEIMQKQAKLQEQR